MTLPAADDPMTPERLAAIEARINDLFPMGHLEPDARELAAEVRRCWAEVEGLREALSVESDAYAAEQAEAVRQFGVAEDLRAENAALLAVIGSFGRDIDDGTISARTARRIKDALVAVAARAAGEGP